MICAGFLLLCGGMGAAGGMAAFANWHPWYTALHRPPLALPQAALAAAWGAVYVDMALAGWQIWRAPDVKMLNLRALLPWGWLLVVKSADICVLFGLHFLLGSALINLALGVLTGVTIRRFLALNAGAALLMAPYAVWTGFEIYLHAGFWFLNQ